jgi:hypothetical protein
MRFLLLATLVFIPGVAAAVTAPRTFAELANNVTNLINAGIGVALILGIVLYFYGIVTALPKSSSGEMAQLRTHLMWGLIALFVMFSVWGITGLIRNTLFGGGAGGYDIGSEDEALCDSIGDCE